MTLDALRRLVRCGAHPMEVLGLLREFERNPEEVRAAYRQILAEMKEQIKEERMKNGLRPLLVLLLAITALAATSCAQVPSATSHVVQLTWTAPSASSSWAGCTTSAPCVYSVWRCTASAATCASTSSTSWVEVTTSATRPSGTSYTDSTAAGLTAYYVVETVQGASNSGPSSMTGPLTVPGVPIAPSLGSPTIAQNDAPPLASPTYLLAMAQPMRLKGRIL